MAVRPETVRRMFHDLLDSACDAKTARETARRLDTLLGWLRSLDEDRLQPLEPAATFHPAAVTTAGPAGQCEVWPPARPPVGGSGYGLPPRRGGETAARRDLPPRGLPPADGLEAMSLVGVAERIMTGQVSPVEVVERALARIEELDGQLKAFITVTADVAREAARRAERCLLAGEPPGRLPGIPVAVKDIIDVAGIRTTCGSRILADHVPSAHAEVASRLLEAGAALVGKTNTHEFAFGPTTVNPHWGSCRNPWNPACVAGGSSGGSAVAVATAMAYLALGTDTAGSVRIPAACCGLVGLKPTYGLLGRQGIFPLSWSLDHPGPLARSVQDVALAMEVLVREGEPSGYLKAARQGAQEAPRVVVGVPAGWTDDRVLPAVAGAVRHALTLLEAMGADVREVPWPPVAAFVLANRLLVLAEAAAVHRPWMRKRAAEYGADVRARLQLGQVLPAVDYLSGQRLRRTLVQAVARAMEGIDIMVTPTLPVPAPYLGQDWLQWPDGEETVPDALVRLTAPFNVTGQPALSLPCDTSGGRPLGLQLIGHAYQEASLLRVAAALEGLLRRRPVPDGDAERRCAPDPAS